ncbi:MAG: hypothetical protein K8T26_11465 [Lentisphaerae bacterium]|nr:hypothetical protein [Lentisphaerota bacterium]
MRRTKSKVKAAQLRLTTIHMARIAELNGMLRHGLTYYTEARIERWIQPLVEALNNHCTFTSHSCHGHWSPRIRRQDPYVSFYVLPGRRREWLTIQRRVFAALGQVVNKTATVAVTASFALPNATPGWYEWRFSPSDYAKARHVFPTQGQWRKAMNRLIGSTSRLLIEEIKGKGVE